MHASRSIVLISLILFTAAHIAHPLYDLSLYVIFPYQPLVSHIRNSTHITPCMHR